MDNFSNYNKSYPLPGISYYMSSISANTQHDPQPILAQPQFDAQQFMGGNEFLTNYQQQTYQQPTSAYVVGQKRTRKMTLNSIQQHMVGGRQDPNTVGGEQESLDGRKLDPFAPECSIPLPYQFGDEYSYYGPTAVWKRNERERHRVRCVNDGYEKLRNHLPVPDKDKRLSKVETLRFAIRYIEHLEKMLSDSNHDERCECDFTIRSSSVSDSCQSPSLTTAEQKDDAKRRKRTRGSCDEVSDNDQ